jgi:hypothetical protein
MNITNMICIGDAFGLLVYYWLIIDYFKKD